MSTNSLIGSPSRISHAKRKMPESFYRPPVQKTQLFSASEILPHSIHHSHTNSLPVDASPQQLASLANAHSANNLYDKSNSVKNTSHMYYLPKNEAQLAISPLVKSEQQYFHSKTYSLPCTFDPVQQNPHLMGNAHNLAPPSRSQNPIGDIPLPPGWSSEKTPTGQAYFINHSLKNTTWEDPRKLYNLPMNQNEICSELRSKIARTIPLPPGWEEARTVNGEVYYINHNIKTTCWEDPRINIYIQQEQQKLYASQNLNQKTPYANGFMDTNHSYQLSQPSLSSSSASITSSNNSIASLSRSDSNLNLAHGPESNQQKFSQNLPNLANKSAKEKIELLNKSLDEVAKQRSVVCKQLEDLSRLESNLKLKLSPQDLEDVLNRLKLNDSKMGSFSSFETKNSKQLTNFIPKNELTPNKGQNEINSPLKDKVTSSDMDSTILAESSTNN